MSLIHWELFIKIGLLNVDGYYNTLLAFIDQAMEEAFISHSASQIIVHAPNAQELIEKLEVPNRLKHIQKQGLR